MDLHHHGDTETGPGLLDFAVNVYAGPRPAWLEAALLEGIAASSAYPGGARPCRARWPPRPHRGRGAPDRGCGRGLHAGRPAAAVAPPRGGAPAVHRAARRAGTALATWAVLGGRSAEREALAVHRHVAESDLAAARQRLTHLVGRDTAALPESEMARAVVESVAENTSDAVVAPLAWGALAGVPGPLAYRAANAGVAEAAFAGALVSALLAAARPSGR